MPYIYVKLVDTLPAMEHVCSLVGAVLFAGLPRDGRMVADTALE